MKLLITKELTTSQVEAMKFLGSFENLREEENLFGKKEYLADTFTVYQDKAYEFLKFVVSNDMQVANDVNGVAKLS